MYKKNVHTLIKKYFIAKNDYPLSEPSMSHNLFTTVASMITDNITTTSIIIMKKFEIYVGITKM